MLPVEPEADEGRGGEDGEAGRAHDDFDEGLGAPLAVDGTMNSTAFLFLLFLLLLLLLLHLVLDQEFRSFHIFRFSHRRLR